MDKEQGSGKTNGEDRGLVQSHTQWMGPKRFSFFFLSLHFVHRVHSTVTSSRRDARL